MEIGDIPVEFSSPPQQLVALSGLDILNSNVHKSIHEYMLTNRKPDRLPLKIVQIHADHVFPKAKPKRTSYESYNALGMWRANWMIKYVNYVPAVVVLFVDLDWNNPHWNEKKLECQSKIDSLRHSLQGRCTRIALVLIQSMVTLPPGDDVIATERATALCSACDLSPKSLFVVPLTDHLYGYIIRLEHAFHELAQAFYTGEMKRVKGKKELLSKTTHQTLLVRCQVKLAFFSQLKQDSHTALRHYKLAYQHATENVMHESDWLEWKTVAGLLNYKICQLCFCHNTPLDAITQFRRHNDFFVDKMPSSSSPYLDVLTFEHATFMCKQLSHFADLFAHAVQNGLAAIQTQHPGFYYQSSSLQAISKKKMASRIKNTVQGHVYPSPDPLQNRDCVQYFGQRPWRVGNIDSNVNPDLELIGMQAVRFIITSTDCSLQILHLLNSAMAQFKRYRCPRMKRFIMVQMGEEYLSRGEYQRALQLLSHAAVEYRAQRWWLLLRETLILALRAAYCTASIRDYIAVCLELLNPNCAGAYVSNEERARIQTNMMKVLAGGPPEPERDMWQAIAETSAGQWRKQMTDRSFFMVQMQQIRSCVLVKAWFSNRNLKRHRAPNLVHIRVSVLLLCPYPMKFSRLSLNLSPEQIYDHHLQMQDKDNCLYFVPNESKIFHFSFLPRQEDIGKDILMTGLSLDIGQLDSAVYGTLRFEPPAVDLSLPLVAPEFVPPAYNTTIFQRMHAPHSITIANRKARVCCEVKFSDVIHVSEIFPVKVTIHSKETVHISKLRVVAESLLTPSEQQPKQSMLYLLRNDNYVQEADFQLGQLNAGCSTSMTLDCCVYDSGDHSLQLMVDYDVDVSEVTGQVRRYTCTYDRQCTVTGMHPLSLQCRLTSILLSPIDRLVLGEKCIVWADLKVAPPDLIIQSVQWNLANHIKFADNTRGIEDVNATVTENQQLTEHAIIEPTAVVDSHSIGSLNVTWKRNATCSSVVTCLPLSKVNMELCPVIVDCILPSKLVVTTPTCISYRVRNQTSTVLECTLCVQAADGFMFSGSKQIQLRLLPSGDRLIELVLLPLIAGLVLLPQIKLICPGHAQTLVDRFSTRNVNEYIFVMPYEAPVLKEIILEE